MLFEVLVIILVAYIFITPYFYFKAVKFGIKIAEKPKEAAEMPFFDVPERRDKPKMTPEEDRMVQILANMDRYDGTSRGQQEIRK